MGDQKMTDAELLERLAEHGTDVSRDELDTHWPRVLEGLERRDSRAEDVAAEGDVPVLEEARPTRAK